MQIKEKFWTSFGPSTRNTAVNSLPYISVAVYLAASVCSKDLPPIALHEYAIPSYSTCSCSSIITYYVMPEALLFFDQFTQTGFHQSDLFIGQAFNSDHLVAVLRQQ